MMIWKNKKKTKDLNSSPKFLHIHKAIFIDSLKCRKNTQKNAKAVTKNKERIMLSWKCVMCGSKK